MPNASLVSFVSSLSPDLFSYATAPDGDCQFHAPGHFEVSDALEPIRVSFVWSALLDTFDATTSAIRAHESYKACCRAYLAVKEESSLDKQIEEAQSLNISVELLQELIDGICNGRIEAVYLTDELSFSLIPSVTDQAPSGFALVDAAFVDTDSSPNSQQLARIEHAVRLLNTYNTGRLSWMEVSTTDAATQKVTHNYFLSPAMNQYRWA
jgi:hypothetical protein